MNLTQTQQDAKQGYLNRQAEQMLALYQNADKTEQNAIIKQIDSFLSVISKDEKLFWLKFRRKLETLNEKAVLFSLGNIYLTVGAREELEESNQTANEFLARHQKGDYGLICEDDRRENELSVKEGFRILSSYKTNSDVKIWVITEADRESTNCFYLKNIKR
ncbi:MAG: hypothetical protein M3Q99_10630 [Acidobacteriota bacterium]|nr:hypothetical protein [Acidobacteriota bacterium]